MPTTSKLRGGMFSKRRYEFQEKIFHLTEGTFIWVGTFLRNFKEGGGYSYLGRFVYLAVDSMGSHYR